MKLCFRITYSNIYTGTIRQEHIIAPAKRLAEKYAIEHRDPVMELTVAECLGKIVPLEGRK